MTPQELVNLTKAIKVRMVEIVTGVLVPEAVVPGEKTPKIIPRLIIDPNYKAWANKLKSPRHKVTENGVELEKVHSVMVYYKGIQDYLDKTVRSMPWKLAFGIDNFYQDDPGTDEDNPEDHHNAEITLAAAALWSARPFGVPKVKSVVSFKEGRGLTTMGDYMVRQSMGTAIVELEPLQLPPRT